MGILDSLKGLCCSKKSAGTENVSLEDKAVAIVEALGGRDNIELLETCITRLRVTLKDRTIVDKAQLTKLGSKGNVKVGEKGLQVIMGNKAEAIAELMRAKL